MNRLHLVYEGLSISVTADSEADLLWLQDFLGPGYRRLNVAPSTSARRFGLHADPDWSLHRHTMEEQAESGTLGTVLAHVLDGSDLHFPCLRQDDGGLLAWDDLFECFYQHDRDGVTTVLQAGGVSRVRRPRLALMRAVREVCLHHELRRGSLALHASGLVHDAGAVLFAGPRRSGKTTLLSACLSLVPDLQLLANDRVMVSPAPGSWLCRGMATGVSVRPGSEDLLPGLHRHLHAHTCGPEAGPDEPLAREYPLNGRLMLSPSQFCRGLGVTRSPETPLGAIVFPRIHASANSLSLRRLDSTAAARAMETALFGAAHPDSRSQLFDIPSSGPYPGAPERESLIRRLTADHPCFECMVGADAYHAKGLERMLHQVLA